MQVGLSSNLQLKSPQHCNNLKNKPLFQLQARRTFLKCVSVSSDTKTSKNAQKTKQSPSKGKKQQQQQQRQPKISQISEELLSQRMNLTKQITLCKDLTTLTEIIDQNDLDHIHLSAILVRSGRMIRDESADQFQIQKFIIDSQILTRFQKFENSIFKLREISNTVWGLWKCGMLDTKQGESVFNKCMDIVAESKIYDIRDVIVLLQVLGMGDHGASHAASMKYLVKLAHRHVADLTPAQLVTVARVMAKYQFVQTKVFDDVLQISGQKIADYQTRQIVELLQSLRTTRYRDITFLQLLANRISKSVQREEQSQGEGEGQKPQPPFGLAVGQNSLPPQGEGQNVLATQGQQGGSKPQPPFEGAGQVQQPSSPPSLKFSPRDVVDIMLCYATFGVRNVSFVQALFKIAKVEEGWSLGVVINCLFCLGLLGITKAENLIQPLTRQLSTLDSKTRFTASQLNYLYFANLLFKLSYIDLQIPDWILQKAQSYWVDKVQRQKFVTNKLTDSILDVLSEEKIQVEKNVSSEDGELLMKLVVNYNDYEIILQPLLYNSFSSNKPYTELSLSKVVRQLWQNQGRITLPVFYYEWDKQEKKFQYLKKKMDKVIPKQS